MQSTALVRDEQRCKKEKQGHRCLAIKVNIKMTDVLETSVPEIKARPSDLKLHKKVFLSLYSTNAGGEKRPQNAVH